MQQGEHGLNFIQNGLKSYMVKTLLLLVLLLIRSNAYAYCYATEWQNGIPVYSSLGVAYNTTMESCQQLACSIFPSIPECGQPPEPPCQDIVEFQSLACEPNYSGAINQTRTKTCSNNQWTDWTTTSNNCSPNPPTCQTSVEERQVACSEGYSGSITEQRQSQCPDPYGQPIFGAWAEISRSCQMTTSNPMNVSSPVSPISPLSATPQETPVLEAQPVMNMDSPAGIAETPKVEASSSATTSSSQTATSTTETKQEAPQKIEVPKGKELVGGFGLVMSLEILNNPITFQQQQLEIALDYSQELPYELRGNQGVLLQFITESNTADTFNRIASDRWNSLRRNYEVQPNY
jgi:hypothetical protein